MKILAIETSCDETGIALVEGHKTPAGFTFVVLKNALLSQAALHAEFGGVYPNLAKREHEKNLPILFKEFENEEVDAIAVTRGPGLEPALWTGVGFAKKIAAQWHKPLLPMNHMEGHLISSLITHTHPNKLENVGMSGELHDVALPVLALLISGGHTEFILMKEWFKYEMVGETQDDAVGEAFDKVARMLALPYPGGPEVSRLAAHARSIKDRPLYSDAKDGPWKLPRPMLNTNNCDTSFSGLKTAVLYALRDQGGIQKLSADEIAACAGEFEDAVTDVLVAKTKRALDETGAKTFVIGGGVAANTHLRTTLTAEVQKEFPDVSVQLPELSITGDNAIMIAEAALLRRLSLHDDATEEDFRAVGNLSIAG